MFLGTSGLGAQPTLMTAMIAKSARIVFIKFPVFSRHMSERTFCSFAVNLRYRHLSTVARSATLAPLRTPPCRALRARSRRRERGGVEPLRLHPRYAPGLPSLAGGQSTIRRRFVDDS